MRQLFIYFQQVTGNSPVDVSAALNIAQGLATRALPGLDILNGATSNVPQVSYYTLI